MMISERINLKIDNPELEHLKKDNSEKGKRKNEHSGNETLKKDNCELEKSETG